MVNLRKSQEHAIVKGQYLQKWHWGTWPATRNRWNWNIILHHTHSLPRSGLETGMQDPEA